MISHAPARWPRAVFAVVATVAVVVSAVGAGGKSDTASPPQAGVSAVGQPGSTPPPAAPPAADPVISRISDSQWALIVETGTWRPGCPVGRKGLRRLDINHVDFQGNVVRGSLVAHRDSVADLADILTDLFNDRFPIQSMEPVELYQGDVNLSLEANNTSAFNCRRPDQINAPVAASPHANGRAIDINPYQNPWQDLRCDCWVPSTDFATTRTGRGVITKGSLPWELFTGRGWIWQNIKVPDYMHFDTGYPSRARPS
jgi:hypothetical protein